MSGASTLASALEGQASGSNISAARRTSSDRGQHSDGNGKDDDESRKRKRIQQACKSCSVKRVKCDGQKPCTTCIKNGETCEYGQPKKRGPPKGSTRGGSKAAARRAAQSAAESGNARSTATQKAPGLPAHPGTLTSNFTQQDSFATQVGQSRGYGQGEGAWPASRRAGGVASNFQAPTLQSSFRDTRYDDPLGRNDRKKERAETSRGSFSTGSAGGDSATSPHSSTTAETRRPPETIFHGTTSGLGILRAQNGGDRRLPPLYFGLRETNYGPPYPGIRDRDARGDVTAAKEMRGSLRSPHWASAVDGPFYRGRDLGDTPSPQNTPRHTGHPPPHGIGRYPEPSRRPPGTAIPSRTTSTSAHTRLQIQLNRGLANAGDPCALAPNEIDLEPLLWETDEEAKRHPRLGGITLTKPEIPRIVVEKVFTIVWGILQTSWPLLYKPALPLHGSHDIIDEGKRPLIYNTVAALASRGWFDGNSSEAAGPAGEVARTRGDWDERKLGKASGHTLTYLDGTTRPVSTQELSSIFLVRARYYLITQYTKPCLESVQAHLIFALRAQGTGHTLQASTFLNKACRMAIDLGLHRNCDFAANLGINFSHAEEQERRRAFWMCYILDKVGCCTQGKPASLRDEEVDCLLPNRDEPDEHEIWAEIASCSLLIDDQARPLLLSTPHRAMSHFLAVIRLAQISERILGLYNVVRDKLPPKEREESWETKLFSIHLALEELEASIGEEFRIEEPTNCLPNRLCLNLWLAVNKLILHRPHILKVPSNPEMPSSHQVCWQEVGRVCNIVEIYAKNFGMRKLSQTFVYVIFTSCTIEIANTTSIDPAVANEAKRRLKLLMDCLPIISGTWHSASQHLEILKRLARGIDANLDGTGIEGQLAGPAGDQMASGAERMASGPDGDFSAGVPPSLNASSRSATLSSVGLDPADAANSLQRTMSPFAQAWQQQQQLQQQPGLERRGRSTLSVAMPMLDNVPGPLGAPMDFSRSRNHLFGSASGSGNDDDVLGFGNDASAATGLLSTLGSSDGAPAQMQQQQQHQQQPHSNRITVPVSSASYDWAPTAEAAPFDVSRGFGGANTPSNTGAGGDLGSNPIFTTQADAPILQAPALASGGVTPNSTGLSSLPSSSGFVSGNPNLDADAMLRFHDASYWGSMPLASEDPLSWANFTNSYVEALATVLAPAGAWNNGAGAGGGDAMTAQPQTQMQPPPPSLHQQGQQPPPPAGQHPSPGIGQRQNMSGHPASTLSHAANIVGTGMGFPPPLNS